MAEQQKDLKEVVEELDAPTTPPPQKWSWKEPNLSLGAFLLIALLAASVVVGVGHTLYVTSSEYKLDITRPGLKDISKEELVEVDRSQSFDSTSPVTIEALDNEQKSMNSRLQDLDRYGDFADQEITNEQKHLLDGTFDAGQ